MHEQLAILSVQYFSNLFLEQNLVKELKNSRVDSWVLTLVKPVTWWYRPLGRSRTTVAVAVWKVSLSWCAEVFTDKILQLKFDWMVESSAWTNNLMFYWWLDLDSKLESANLILFGVLFPTPNWWWGNTPKLVLGWI